MGIKMSVDSAKKRLMYLSGEDFYLYCYSIFIILDALGSSSGKAFRDYRKLAFLVNIINDEKLVYILSNSKGESLNPYDKECLFASYSEGLSKRSEILKLVFTLEKKGFLVLSKGKRKEEIDVSLVKEKIPEGCFDPDVFSLDYQRVLIVKKSVPRLKGMILETMLERIYSDNGVKTWGI